METLQCMESYGFPTGTRVCARCSDNEDCKRKTRLKYGHRIRWLSQKTVTVLTGGYVHGRDFSTVVTLPIHKELYARLLGYAGTQKQDIVFLINRDGTATDFKTIEDWRKAVDVQQ